ncbi:amidohydrolase family protein [Sphingomonas abietis]|uniref:Amidohydrolase family protein n=2 Tax=Sphingomonas abietis TaxID=3012344 RepID=A0ABY7NT04_9SPHN|nr:amidohydrolase family protein [Sphingomonas abietis]
MYDPGDASVERYMRMARTVGIERVVVVNGSPYGADNRCILDSIKAFDAVLGAGQARGVAVIEPEISDEALMALRDGGICGMRINVMTGRTPISALPTIASRIAPLGMHVQLWVKGEQLAEVAQVLPDLAVPIVIDHLGQAPIPEGVQHPTFQTLLRLLEDQRVWAKLVGYRVSAGPPYSDLAAPVAAILDVAADRCVWGTDWPHPFLEGKPMPNDGDLLDLLASWCTPEQFKAVLVDNPARLYGF